MTTALPSADHRSGEGARSDAGNGLATSQLAIGGMHCASCAQRVQRSLRAVPAVASVAVNLATERAYVTFDPAASSTDQLCAAVAAGGYSAEPALEEQSVSDEPIDREGWRWRAIVSWPLALAALLVSLLAPEDATSGWIVLLLAVAVQVVGGWPFLRSSVRLLRHGATSMDTLIALGTLAALAVRRWRRLPSGVDTFTSAGVGPSPPGSTAPWRRSSSPSSSPVEPSRPGARPAPVGHCTPCSPSAPHGPGRQRQWGRRR